MDRKEYGAYLLAGILAAFLVFARESMSLGSWDELVVVCFTIVFVLLARWVFFPHLRAEGYFPLIYVGLLAVVGAALGFRSWEGWLAPLLCFAWAAPLCYLLAGAGEVILAVIKHVGDPPLPDRIDFVRVHETKEESYRLALRLGMVVALLVYFAQGYLWWIGGNGYVLGFVGAVAIWCCFFLLAYHVQGLVRTWAEGWAVVVENGMQDCFLQGLAPDGDIITISAKLTFYRMMEEKLEEVLDPGLPAHLLWPAVLLGMVPLILCVVFSLWPL
ncbi:MAG: hypothetical protein ACOX20_00775 [Limnochordia bacterium]|nr:hypothetical protein [Bacillota bacterium]